MEQSGRFCVKSLYIFANQTKHFLIFCETLQIGQSEGIEDGYKLTFQENFDSGYKCAFEMAFKIGVLKGLMKCQGTEDAKIDNCLLCEKEEKFKELSLEDTQKIHNKHEVDKTKILKNLAKPILEKSNIEKVDFLQ